MPVNEETKTRMCIRLEKELVLLCEISENEGVKKKQADRHTN